MIINILKELSNNPSNLINSSQKKKKMLKNFFMYHIEFNQKRYIDLLINNIQISNST